VKRAKSSFEDFPFLFLDVGRLKRGVDKWREAWYNIVTMKGTDNPLKRERKIHMAKCLHPRIALRLMTEFVNSASDLVYYGKEEDEHMMRICTEAEAKADPTIKAYKKECIIRKGECFETRDDWDYFFIHYNYDSLEDIDSLFMQEFLYDKLPHIFDFHFIVFVLLHELGHNETAHLLGDYDREVELDKLAKIPNPIEAAESYFTLKDEWLATTWAANWLLDENHQRIAKEFETKFLACFE
jgi:hypothetical protein